MVTIEVNHVLYSKVYHKLCFHMHIEFLFTNNQSEWITCCSHGNDRG